MSGFGAVWARSRDDVEPLITALISAQRHRGPDGVAKWTADRVGLTHATLNAVPEAMHESQPVHLRGGGALAADLRLDNREELLRALDVEPSTGATLGDATLLARAYESWGFAAPERLRGDFAFVLWDAARACWFGARDRFGIKPFFYCSEPSGFVCASEAQAVLQLGLVPPVPDEEMLLAYLGNGLEHEDRTALRGLRRLPPAHAFRLDNQGLRVWPYWSLEVEREVSFAHDSDYADAFAEVFRQAVRRRLRVSGRVGAQLSGGLDSSSVALVASRELEHRGAAPLLALAAGFPAGSPADESVYQRSVLGRGRFDLVAVSPRTDAHRLPVEDAVRCLGAPRNVGGHWMAWPVAARARDAGARVVLTGLDGDRVVSHGWGYRRELLVEGQARALIREAARSSDLPVTGRVRLLVGAAAAALPHDWRVALLPPRPRVPRPEFLGSVLRHEPPLPEYSAGARVRDEHARRLLAPDRTWDLEVEDVCGHQHGWEPRHPFFDQELVEFCLALPCLQKARTGETRYVLRAGLRDELPPELVRRTTKAYFDEEFRVWSEPEVQRWLAAEASGLERLDPYVKLDSVRRLLDLARQGAGSLLREEWEFVWRCCVLSHWLAQFEDV
jgi:asparagine synthase (glutamine-hydrolysing)